MVFVRHIVMWKPPIWTIMLSNIKFTSNVFMHSSYVEDCQNDIHACWRGCNCRHVANIHSGWIFHGSQLPFCVCWASACVFIRHFAQATIFLLEAELLFMLITSCYSRGIRPALVGIYWSNSVRSALNERCSFLWNYSLVQQTPVLSSSFHSQHELGISVG